MKEPLGQCDSGWK